MTVYREFRVGGNPNNPFGFIVPIMILAGFFVLLYFFFKGLFTVLSYAAPVLLILTFIIDYKVVKNYFLFLLGLLKDNPLLGILAIVFAFFAYPFVAGYLFFKALAGRTIRKKIEAIEKEKNRFDEFEEVTEDDQFLELPQLQKTEPKPKTNPNPYDDVFK